MDDEIIRLLPKKKKGILRIVFSRTALIALLFIAESGLVYVGYRWFNSYFSLFKTIQTVFSIVMVVYLFNCGMDASAKLTWLFLILIFPVPAVIMLWISRADIGHRIVKKRVNGLIRETANMIPQDEAVVGNPALIDSGTDDLCRYLCRSGNFPIYDDTETAYYPSGEAWFEVLKEELMKAESFIFLEYFIIGEGYMWGRVLKILADKAKEGVDVRVMYDGMCEVKLLPHDYPKRMAELGIKCRPFTPITPFFSTQYNYRDHRKIAVIDGRTAFTGGVNLSDEYINRTVLYGYWKDAALMVRGRAAQSFTLMFLQMWNLSEKEPDWTPARVSYSAGKNDGFVMPYADSPLDEEKVGENVYIDILYKAKHYVHIMTPYLILDNEMENALKFAAERGVDVKLILPGIPDKKVAYSQARMHFGSLLKSGVKLYEYTPGFVHSKVFVSDDDKAVVGSINLDYRSLYHHFECASYLYKCSCIGDIVADFDNTLSECRQITEENYRKEKLLYRLVGMLLKVLAPLM